MSLAGMDEVSPELVDAAMGILLELLSELPVVFWFPEPDFRAAVIS
jgi:hypothetical protein